MSGGYYIALSGMRTRIDQLDRLAEDLANSAHRRLQGRTHVVRDREPSEASRTRWKRRST